MPDHELWNTKTAPRPLPFLVNLRAALRLAFFMPVRADQFVFSSAQIGTFVVLQMAIWLSYDYVDAGRQPAFDTYGITSAATGYLLLGLSAYALAVLLGAKAFFARILLVMVAVTPVTSVVYLGLTAFLEATGNANYSTRWGVWWFVTAWLLAIVFRAFGVLAVVARTRALFCTGVYAAFNLVPAFFLPNTAFWYDKSSSALAQGPRVNVEDTYYRQGRLLDAIEISASTPGKIDLYFLGVAPYARQDVFKSEVLYTQRLFDERFGTRGRSVALINHGTTVKNTPLATVHNIEHVLQRFAERMDAEEDILFLYLTSHGSRDARLAADFYPLQPNNIAADELRAMIDRSGIRWRVIVVSACFSGSFVEKLASPTTLVVTASHAKRQSFGCANGREFTYFGEAFIRDALAEADSFVSAFEDAKVAIAAREQSEGLTASKPQLRVGADIETQLARYHAQAR